MIGELALVLLGTALLDNIVLLQFMGAGAALGAPAGRRAALALCLLTALVLVASTVLSYLLFHKVLEPLGLAWLRTLAFVLIVATVVQFAALYLRGTRALLHRALGPLLALTAANAAVLGSALLATEQPGLAHAIALSLGAAAGLALALLLLHDIMQRVNAADVPWPFRGLPVALVTAGLAALAFMGLAGLG